MISVVLVVAYLIALTLCFCATAITAIVWLCLKTPSKNTCGNILIVVSSIFAVVGVLGNPLANYVKERHEMAFFKSPLVTSDAVINKADAAANAIEKSEALKLVKSEFPYLEPFTEFLALPNEEEARSSLTEFFKKLPADDKRRSRIIMRQNIFEHEIGAPFTMEGKLDSSRESFQKFLSLIRNVDKPITPQQLPEAVASATYNLPEGFCQYSLLKAIYKSAGDEQQLKALTAQHQVRIKQRMHKLLTGIVFSYSIIFAGILVLIFSAKSLSSKHAYQYAEDSVQEISIRRIYCFGLVLYYAQFCLGFPLGLVVAFVPQIASSLKNSAIPLTTATLALNLILMILCTTWTIFKPMGLKTVPTIQKLFGGNILNSAALGLGAFCAVKALVAIFYWIVYAIFQQSPSTNNPIVDQITAASLDPNALTMTLLWMSIAVLAPLGEEFAFRGLLYTSIKSRAGAFAGIIFSGAIFAAYHMDPGSFMGLFGFGMGVAFLFERTKSLLPCVFMHAMWNSSFLLLAWLMV